MVDQHICTPQNKIDRKQSKFWSFDAVDCNYTYSVYKVPDGSVNIQSFFFFFIPQTECEMNLN